MTKYAQTNLQLFEQLFALGYSEADMIRADKGHRLMMRLMSAQYKASGKPFLAHVVGTASILAAHGAEPDLVVAGLTHAAYDFGSFGAMMPGTDPTKRRVVADAIGAKAEEIVNDYTSIRGGSQDDLKEDFAQVPPLRRSSFFIVAANELEDSLDLGLHYGAPSRRQTGRQNLELARAFAKLLQLGALVDEIDVAITGLKQDIVPASLSSSETHGKTLHSTTASQRIVLALKYRFRSLKNRLGSNQK